MKRCLYFLVLGVLLISSCMGVDDSGPSAENASLERVTQVPWEFGRITAVYQKNDTAYLFNENGAAYFWTSTDSIPKSFTLKGGLEDFYSLLRDQDDLYVAGAKAWHSDSMMLSRINLQNASVEGYLVFARSTFAMPIWLGTVSGRSTLVSENCEIAQFSDTDRTLDVKYRSGTPCEASQVEQVDDSTLVWRENSRIVVSAALSSNGLPPKLDTLYRSADVMDYIILYKDRDNGVKGVFGETVYRIQGGQALPVLNLPLNVGTGYGSKTVPVTIGNKSFVCNENLILSDSGFQYRAYEVETHIHGFYGTASDLCFSMKGDLFYPVDEVIYRVVLGKPEWG